jgi:intracellular multiplication protein IcmL
MGYLAATKQPMTFGVSDKGTIIPLVPMDQPYLGDARIISFADECVRQAFSHDFRNFRQTVNGAKGCFTTEGAIGFDKAIEPLIADIIARRMVMSVTTQPPIVNRKAPVRGVHTWVVQTQMTLFRDGSKERISPATYTVDLVIERIPLEASVRGVGVAQINVRPGNAS